MIYVSSSSKKVRLVGLTLLAGFSACASPLDSGTPFAKAVVRGTVSDAGGNPVVGATVGANNFLLPCPAGANALGSNDASTNSNGFYRIEITTLTAPQMECIAVTVTPVGGMAKSVSGAQVQFKPVGQLPYDSVTVDVVVP
jgi:hypothetical protein